MVLPPLKNNYNGRRKTTGFNCAKFHCSAYLYFHSPPHHTVKLKAASSTKLYQSDQDFIVGITYSFEYYNTLSNLQPAITIVKSLI